MQNRCRFTALAALGILAFAAPAPAAEDPIPVKELPKAVTKAVKAKFPKGKIHGAAKEVVDGKTTYEAMLTVEGRAVDVALAADGTILEIEKEIPADRLPKAVRGRVESRYPHAKIVKAEELIKGAHNPVQYEITVQAELVVNATGKVAAGE